MDGPFREEPDLYSTSPAPKTFIDWLRTNRNEIKLEWSQRLSRLSSFYRGTSPDELNRTVSRALEANFEYLSTGNLTKIKKFIDYITKKRLKAGFPLSDVQKAFELFRLIVIDRLAGERLFEFLAESVHSVNGCLSYTIHRFSDHYQRMHELSISRYAQNLEEAIRDRTTELAYSEKRYKTLVEEINDGYFIIQNETIIFANQAFCSMHGVRLRQVIGKPFTGLVAPGSRMTLINAYEEIMKGGPGSGPVQYNVAGKFGQSACREVRARRTDIGAGTVIIGICRDISERVSMEARVREHEQMAYIGRLSASLSHEIRNPLSSIKMNLQILERKLDLDGYDRRRLEISVHEVSRLEDILRQLLDTARPLSVNKTPGDLNAIAGRCIDLLEPKALEKSLKITQRLPADLHQTELDSPKIQQAVINLLLNAIEACPYGGRVHIWTKSLKGKKSGYIELGVRDNGPGISPDQANRLFTPFSTSKIYGNGLGLSNVKRIVEAHSGTVQVQSREGHGAIFVIKLPVHIS